MSDWTVVGIAASASGESLGDGGLHFISGDRSGQFRRNVHFRHGRRSRSFRKRNRPPGTRTDRSCGVRYLLSEYPHDSLVHLRQRVDSLVPRLESQRWDLRRRVDVGDEHQLHDVDRVKFLGTDQGSLSVVAALHARNDKGSPERDPFFVPRCSGSEQATPIKNERSSALPA